MNPIAPIRVAVADDHPVYRSGLRTLVEENPLMDFAGEAADGDEAIKVCRQQAPDVILMDIRMPGTSGVEATRRIIAEQPTVGVLILTMLEDDTSVFAAMRAGARGYVLKGAAPEEIIRAVTVVAAGDAIFSAGVARRMSSYFDPHSRASTFPELSSRERDILDLLAAGRPNPDIVARLGLSEKTVRNNVSNIFTKLRVTDRSAAIIRAREAGLGS